MVDDGPLASYGLPVLPEPVALPHDVLSLVTRGVAKLWRRIVAADTGAERRPLLLSYDVHVGPEGPVLIEVNTNAGGFLAAMQATRYGNACCPDLEADWLTGRLLDLFDRDLLDSGTGEGAVAVVDDELASQPLLAEMQALARLLRSREVPVIVVDAAELSFVGGKLRHGDTVIERVYWRSTDFTLSEPAHAPVKAALDAGAIVLAPSPEAYRAIADKRRFLEWSRQPDLARDETTGMSFRVAETRTVGERDAAQWYADRREWVFKPASGFGSRGVYVGKSISRRKLAELMNQEYLAQRYVPHPEVDRAGHAWKYDLRFFADRDEIIGAAARVFQGQTVSMRTAGSGVASLRVGDACCFSGALANPAASSRAGDSTDSPRC